MRRGSDQDVARLLGISVDRLQKRIQTGIAAPPYLQVPGSRSRIWDMDDVEAWLKEFRCVTPQIHASITPVKRGRGRLTKTEQRRRSV